MNSGQPEVESVEQGEDIVPENLSHGFGLVLRLNILQAALLLGRHLFLGEAGGQGGLQPFGLMVVHFHLPIFDFFYQPAL